MVSMARACMEMGGARERKQHEGEQAVEQAVRFSRLGGAKAQNVQKRRNEAERRESARTSAARATWPESYEEVSVVSSAALQAMRRTPRTTRATVVREERCGWRNALDLRTSRGVSEEEKEDEHEAAAALCFVLAGGRGGE